MTERKTDDKITKSSQSEPNERDGLSSNNHENYVDEATSETHTCNSDSLRNGNVNDNSKMSFKEAAKKIVNTHSKEVRLRKKTLPSNDGKTKNQTEKRKTIACVEPDMTSLFDEWDTLEKSAAYYDRIKMRSKLKVWKRLTDICKHFNKTDTKRQIEEYYLEKVSEGSVEDVRSLFKLCQDNVIFKFNRDIHDQDDKSALTIAIVQKNAEMCELLLEHKVALKDSIYHAIDQNFVEGVKLILKQDHCSSSCIYNEHSYFKIGTTPFSLAALNNNYTILRLLQQHGHFLKVSLNFKEGIQHAWESRAIRKLHWMTECSPAYITLVCENGDRNAMDYCIDIIAKLRANAQLETEHREFYKELASQVEDYMCQLLDQIQSSAELANLYGYKSHRTQQYRLYRDSEVSENTDEKETNLNILERACAMKLFKFVNHENSQLVLSYLLYRNTPFVRVGGVFRRVIPRFFIGLLFPLWSLFYLVAPWSKIGSFIKTPSVLFECHSMSSYMFLALLIINITTKSVENDYLGAPPTVDEILIVLWVFGKWVEEIRECEKRGIRSYLGDWWNYNDLLRLFLFTTCVALRVVDFVNHKDDKERIFRVDWSNNDPRLISVGFLACFYVLVFLRVLGFTRTNRTLGPLRITLSKMLGDVINFFVIFTLIMFAFGIGLSELFWYYGTTLGARALCLKANDTGGNCDEDPIFPFSGLWSSLKNLFWALFGYLDPHALLLNGSHPYIEVLGILLVAAFHVAVILVLLNMLIAMMTKSFEVTSENEELEWRFYRAVIWIRFIRGDYTIPAPMNLIPNFYYFYKKCSIICVKSNSEQTVETDAPTQAEDGNVVTQNPQKLIQADKLTKHTNLLIRRYKLHKLLDKQSDITKLSPADII